MGAAALAGSAYLVLSGTHSVALAMAVLFLEAVGVAVGNVTTLSLRQRITPPYLLGRVASTFRLLIWGLIPFGALAGGASDLARGYSVGVPDLRFVQPVVVAMAAPALIVRIHKAEQPGGTPRSDRRPLSRVTTMESLSLAWPTTSPSSRIIAVRRAATWTGVRMGREHGCAALARTLATKRGSTCLRVGVGLHRRHGGCRRFCVGGDTPRPRHVPHPPGVVLASGLCRPGWSSLLAVTIPVRGVRHSGGLPEVPLVVGVVYLSPLGLLLAVVVAQVIVGVLKRRPRPKPSSMS